MAKCGGGTKKGGKKGKGGRKQYARCETTPSGSSKENY